MGEYCKESISLRGQGGGGSKEKGIVLLGSNQKKKGKERGHLNGALVKEGPFTVGRAKRKAGSKDTPGAGGRKRTMSVIRSSHQSTSIEKKKHSAQSSSEEKEKRIYGGIQIRQKP